MPTLEEIMTSKGFQIAGIENINAVVARKIAENTEYKNHFIIE